MIDLQRTAFDWIAHQPALTGLVVLLGGLFCATTGARFTRFLVTVFAVATGSVVGLVLAAIFGVAPLGLIAAFAFAGGFAAILWPATMLVTLAALGWGVLAIYLCYQLGFRGDTTLVSFALGFIGGCALTALNRATMTVLLTSVLGTATMIVGFIGVASGVVPALGETLQSLAVSQPLAAPILLGMLAVTTYSYQANSFRGDIITGGYAEPRKE